MNKKAVIEDFLAQQGLAVLGASRGGKKFGNFAYRELKKKGYRLFPVHPQAETIEGDRCFAALDDLPEEVAGIFVSLPPEETLKVVEDASRLGIRRIWIQQGAGSPRVVARCEEEGLGAVHDECILMFAPPVGSFHKIHRWLWKALGKLP